MNFPVWKKKDGEEPILVMDMVQNAMLGPDYVELPTEVVVKRGPGRPPKEKAA